jgi:hypothetical protein
MDNVFIERLWRSLKYEDVYLKDYSDGWDAEASLAAYFRFYNEERIHQSLLSVPIGVGLKFFHSPYHTLRLEAYDNIAWGDGKLKTMQNFTLAAGVEFRFGGRPTSYFPWHGGTAYW